MAHVLDHQRNDKTSVITVLSPVKAASKADPESPGGAKAERAPLDDGAHLLLIDNGKSQAKFVLGLVADEVRRRVPEISSVEVFSKATASAVLSDDEARMLAERSSLAIAGLGDCGACSSCSALDAIKLENMGVPSTVVITDAFVGLVEKFARGAGMAGYHNVVLPHPVATRPEAELQQLVADLTEQVVEQLTGDAPAHAPRPSGAPG